MFPFNSWFYVIVKVWEIGHKAILSINYITHDIPLFILSCP